MCISKLIGITCICIRPLQSRAGCSLISKGITEAVMTVVRKLPLKTGHEGSLISDCVRVSETDVQSQEELIPALLGAVTGSVAN